MASAIDLIIHHHFNAAGSRRGELLKAVADGALETMGAVEIGGEQGNDAGREPDDQE